VISKSSLLNPTVHVPREQLKIRYRDKDVADLSIIRVRIKNSGRQPITDIEIEEPLRITIGDVDDIISAEIVDAQPPALRMTAKVDPDSKSIVLEKKLLNEGDTFSVEIIGIPTAGKEPSVTGVTGRIKGVKEITLRASAESTTPQTGVRDWGVAIAAVAAVLATSINSLFKYIAVYFKKM
jgi:hypothetical protein